MRSGFTLIEITVSIAIIVLVGSLALVSFQQLRASRDLTVAGQDTLSLLRLAQARALAGEGNSAWGVRLEPERATLFRGSSYAGATLLEPHDLPSRIEIADVALSGGGIDAVFDRVTGRTQFYGTFELRVKGSGATAFPVTVDASGQAYRTGTAPVPDGTRIADARHRAFALGWSIQNAVTMTLTFSNPPLADVIYPVVMVPYFNGDQTEFDWSGSVAVGGEDQELRIHTTSLNASDTVLHVDRDCRKNTKGVRIDIDLKTIATLDADCQTVTVGPFGGVMSEP